MFPTHLDKNPVFWVNKFTMKKTVHKKRRVSSKTKSNRQAILFFRYSAITLGVLALLFVGKFLIDAATTVHVLGTNTGPVILARGENDGAEDVEDPEEPEQPEVEDSGSDSNSSDSQDSGKSTPSQNSTSTSLDSKVDCTGPDGKHFVTSFHDCQELNKKWGISNFQFTIVGTRKSESSGEEKKGKKSTDSKIEIQTEGNKGEINIEKSGTHIEIKREDDGRIHLKEKSEDGTEIELEEKDELEKLNDELEDEGIEIGTGSATKFAFKSGNVEAHTNFALSVDRTTKKLSVTTASGTHEVAVLPDKAIENLIAQGIITNVLSTSTTTLADSTNANNVVGITEIDNNPAFEVHGVLDEKVLGLFPVAFTKTVYVSTENGTILKTEQSGYDKFLEAISF